MVKIRRLVDRPSYLKTIFYGRSKVGKTWLIGSMGAMGRVALVTSAVEGSYNALHGHPHEDKIDILHVPQILEQDTFTPIEDLQDVITEIKHAHKKHKWYAVAFDTMSVLSDHIITELTQGKEGKKVELRVVGHKDAPVPYAQGRIKSRNPWAYLIDLFDSFRRALHGLPVHVVYSFHEEESEARDGEHKGSRELRPRFLGQNLGKLEPYVDLSVWLERKDVEERDENEKLVGIKSRRRLWFRQPPSAKILPLRVSCRFEDKVPPEGYIENPTWRKIVKLFEGRVKT